MRDHEIVDSGRSWTLDKDPWTKGMLPNLLNNQSIVTWIIPRGIDQQDGNSVVKQIPVIRIKRKYHPLSLRMMKAIWNNVRLAKDFDNIDVCHDGRQKLRIPVKLFIEKKRTQNRFTVSDVCAHTPPCIFVRTHHENYGTG